MNSGYDVISFVLSFGFGQNLGSFSCGRTNDDSRTNIFTYKSDRGTRKFSKIVVKRPLNLKLLFWKYFVINELVDRFAPGFIDLERQQQEISA
jgi:hypothetical protein